MSRWFRQQGYVFSATWGHLRAAPGNFFLNMLVLAMTLALPFAGATLLKNIQPISAQVAVNTEISVFMKMETTRKQATTLAFPLRRIFQQQEQPVKIFFIPKEKALERLKAKMALSDVVDTLGSNPLPDSYVLRMAPYQRGLSALKLEAIIAQLEELPHIKKIQLDSAWVKRLAALLHVLRLALYFLGGTLGVVVIAVTFNTIRLQVLAHRDEIWLLQLVGATDNFICRPFHYSGILLGLGAGGIALGVVALALHPLNAAVADLAKLYASELQLIPLDLSTSALLLALSALLGWAGAVLSIRRHLSQPK